MKRILLALLFCLPLATSGQTIYINSYRFSPSAPATDPDATAYIDSVLAGGFSLSTTLQSAYNKLAFDLKAAGSYAKFSGLWFAVNGSAGACKLNFVNPVDADPAYRVTWYGSPTFSANGVQFANSSQYGDTHLTDGTSDCPQDGFGFMVYSRTNAPGAGDLEMGNYGSAYMLISYTSNFYVQLHNPQVGPLTAIYPDTRGFFLEQRIDASNLEYRRNGTLTSSYNINSTGYNSLPIYIGTPLPNSLTTSKEITVFGVLKSPLTGAEDAATYTAFQTFFTTLGIQV